MKTKNNVQKTFLRTIAVIISFVLLSLTVTAQGYWKQLLTNNSFNRIASALVENSAMVSSDSNTMLASAGDNFILSQEESLQLEPWMVEPSLDINMNDMPEPALEIRDWMLDNSVVSVENDIDAPLGLQAWMF